MTEDELLDAVMDALALYGWTAQHARRSDAALVMGTPGFPDVLAVRDGQQLAVELKGERGRLSFQQGLWLAELHAVQHAEARIMRPRDLDAFLDELRRRHGAIEPWSAAGRLALELELTPDPPEPTRLSR